MVLVSGEECDVKTGLIWLLVTGFLDPKYALMIEIAFLSVTMGL